MNLQAGQIIADKYRIVRQIGQGGMGSVYEGDNIRIHRRVAIKTLHAAVAGKGDMLQRFEREAQAAGRIGSEHICEVLDMGDLPDGSRFMVMEFLDGTTLGDRIVKEGRIAPRDLVKVMSQMLEGLNAAHQAGIIHRDLKPANIFLQQSRSARPDFVKILDFGVSKFNVLASDEMSMTRTGAVMGTPYYMSPEQAKGARAIDMRSDLYSVGVIMYEAITGQVPFNAQTFNELIFKIALESPPPPEQFVPNLDPAFGVMLRKAMARDPAERFQTAAELKETILAWARDFDARGGMHAPPHPQQGQHQQAHYQQGQQQQQGHHQQGQQQQGQQQQGQQQHGQHAPAAVQPFPMVGAMGRGSSPQLMPPQHVAGPAATVIANAPFGPGQTQYADPAGPVGAGQGAPLPARKSPLAILIALAAALLVASAGAYFVYGRSTARAGPTEPASDAEETRARPSATAVASERPKPDASSATPSATPQASASEPTLDLTQPDPPTTAAPTSTSTSTRPWVRPTARATAIRTSPPPPPPPGRGGRDIRPDL